MKKEYRNESGQYHRIDGPAVEYSNGSKEWYINGKLHRENGPAIILGNGVKCWFLNDIEYTEEEYQNELIKLKLNRLRNL
jgi:hypothetical protein